MPALIVLAFCVWTTSASPASGQLDAEVPAFQLSQPTCGETGSVDASIAAPDYLMATSNAAGINPDRTARATLGVYKGANKFIYLRAAR